MAGRAKSRAVKEDVGLDELFHQELWFWYQQERARIRENYNPLTKRFLDFNAPMDPRTPRFLREPQSQALEIYVFLKEIMVTRDKGGHKHEPLPVYDIFDRWYRKEAPFARRPDIGMSVDRQQALVSPKFAEQAFAPTYARMKAGAGSANYANYIFALTMGTGKTLLMLTCIFYEFLLAARYPKAKHYAHNALIFAPDLTVLETLRADIETFDRERVVPKEYLHILDAATPHYLLQPGDTLQGLSEKYNIVVSNAQKIILKRNAAKRSPGDALFKGFGKAYQPTVGDLAAAELFDTPEIENELELVTNQRYESIRKLKQLGVFIDEAHHAYGTVLQRNINPEDANDLTSLRNTVNRLHADLANRKTRMVGCYNFTGTPYAQGEVFPEVVYAYGLKKAVDNEYLKKVRVVSLDETKISEAEFLERSVLEFLDEHGTNRYEGMLPKMAIFGAGKDELRGPIYTAVVNALAKRRITGRSVLINVEDSGAVEKEAFKLLDTTESEKQFVLLVGKGREGWNCRSLFSVLLYRKPRSKVFVLQASTRCLRSVACPPQQTGTIYLSEVCRKLLDDELAANYKVTVDELSGTSTPEVDVYVVKPTKPVPEVQIVRTLQRWDVTRIAKPIPPKLDFSDERLEALRIYRTESQGLLSSGDEGVRLVTEIFREQQRYSPITLCWEIARYLGPEVSPIEVERLLEGVSGGISAVLQKVNQHNELLSDVILDLFRQMYAARLYSSPDPVSVSLVRDENAHYSLKAKPSLVVRLDDHVAQGERSFHLDHYLFASGSERVFFEALIASGKVKSIYFTGMLTQGQTDFYIEYLDPTQEGAPRRYYPDFLVELHDGERIIFEVKRDTEIEKEVVQAKTKAASELAGASKRMRYSCVPSSHADSGRSLEYLAEPVASSSMFAPK